MPPVSLQLDAAIESCCPQYSQSPSRRRRVAGSYYAAPYVSAMPFMEGSMRPNLSRACQKTKLCAFYVRGECPRGDTCKFAHGESELKVPPNLQRTRLCPAVVAGGQCAKAACKFAHSSDEIRQPDADFSATPSTPSVASHVVPTFACSAELYAGAEHLNGLAYGSDWEGHSPYFWEQPCVPFMHMALGLTAAAGVAACASASGAALGITAAAGVSVAVAHSLPSRKPSRNEGVDSGCCATDSDGSSQVSTNENSADLNSNEGNTDIDGSGGTAALLNEGTVSQPIARFERIRLVEGAWADAASDDGDRSDVENDSCEAEIGGRESEGSTVVDAALPSPSGVETLVRNTFLHFSEVITFDGEPLLRRSSSAP